MQDVCLLLRTELQSGADMNPSADSQYGEGGLLIYCAEMKCEGRAMAKQSQMFAYMTEAFMGDMRMRML